MKPVSTACAAISPCWLLLGACLLGAMVLGGCSCRGSAVPGERPRPQAVAPPEKAPPSQPTPKPGAPSAAVSHAPAAEAAEAEEQAAGRESPNGPADTSVAILRVERQEPYVVFPAVRGETLAEYTFYKATQMQLMKARFVLAAALRKPDVERLPCLRRGAARRDAVGWLSGQLRVESPGEAAIVRVSLSCGDAEAAAVLVNAVIHAYLEEVAGMELKERELRIDQLDRLYCEKEEELRRNHNVLRQLAEQMGTAETAAGFVDQQLALQEAIDARREFSAARGELRRAKAERKAGEALLNNTASTDVPDFEVDALAQNDPLINQVLLPLVADLKKQLLGADAAATQRLTDKLKAVQGEIGTRRGELRQGEESRKRAAIEADLRRVQCQIDALEQLVLDRQEGLEPLEKKAVRARRTSVDLEMEQGKIRQLEEVVRAIGRQREQLNIELHAAPRITLLQAAEVPEKKDPTERSL